MAPKAVIAKPARSEQEHADCVQEPDGRVDLVLAQSTHELVGYIKERKPCWQEP
jgi:hypothetical protein